MGFQSQSGQVGFKTQTTPDTYDDPGTGGVFMRTRGGSLGPNRDLIIPDPEIGGVRDVPDAFLGAVSWSGEIEFYARMDALATLLYGAFGAKSAPVVGGAAPDDTWWTHTFTPIDTGALPFLSLEENVAGTFDTFRYTDMKVNGIHLESDANGYLMGNFSGIARKQTAGNTKTAAPDFDTSPLMIGTNINVTLDGAALPAKSFSFDFLNNLEDDDFRLGSFYLGEISEKRRDVNAGFTIRPEDSGYWRQAVYGTAGATAPGGIVTKDALVINAQTYEFAGTSVTQTYELTITIPQVSIEPFAAEPSGDDIIEHDITLRALRPSNATPICTVEVVNTRATVA